MGLFEQWQDLVIATAVLLDAPEPTYDDFGHPERATARKYWTLSTTGYPTLMGHTRAEVLLHWLARQGFTVTKRLVVIKITPTSRSNPT
jgi:hypothetical protein